MIRLFWLCCLVSANALDIHPFMKEDNILTLGEVTWADAQEYIGGLLVYFYTSYCLPCRQFWPEFHKAAQNLTSLETSVKFAKVNCEEEQALCRSSSIKEFPTVYFYRPYREPYEYRGARNSEALTRWVQKVADFKYETVNDLNTLFRDFTLAILFDTPTEAIDSAYLELFDDIEIAKVGPGLTYLVEQEVAILITQRGHIVPIRETDSVRTIKAKVAKILKVDKETLPVFNWEMYRKFQTEDHDFVLFFRTLSFRLDDHSTDVFDEVGKELDNEKLVFTYVNSVDDLLGFELGNVVGVTEDSEPGIAIISRNGPIIKKYKMDNLENLTKESFKQFITQFQQGTLERFYLSAEIPEKDNGPIKELVSKNFEEVVGNPELNVFVMLYLPLCESCVDVDAGWEALAYRLRNNKSIMIARVDMSKNDLKGFDLWEYPTFVLYLAGSKKEPIKFSASVNYKEIQKFLLENVPVVTVDIEL